MLFTDKTFENCLSNIQSGKIKAVIFTGKNYGLSTILADKIVSIFNPEETVFLDYQDDKKDTPFLLNLKTNLQSGFFSNRKLIKVYNIKSKRGISKELSFLDEECISDKMVLLFGTEIDGKCELKSFFEKGEQIACVNLYEDDEKTAINVINQFFQENNKQIEASAVKAIAEMLHGDRKALLCECEKMLMYCNDKNITLNDVEIAIESEQASNSIAFADFVLSGDFKKALKEFELLEKDDVPIIMLVRTFIRAVEEVVDIKQMVVSGGDIDSAIKSKFLFWKRIPFIKIAVMKNNITALNSYIKTSLKVEKMSKIYGETIAKQVFIREIILKNIR